MQIQPVPVDHDGLRVSEIGDVDAALVTPAHHFPVGVVLAPARRLELLDWLAAGDRLLIEDDYDAEHRYDRAPVSALQPANPDRIAYTGSASKSLAPALRLGWLAAPAALRADLVEAKYMSDLGSATIPQLTLARFIADGDYDRHLRRTRAQHRSRRDALVGALRELLPSCPVLGIPAGLHVVMMLPDGSDDTAMVQQLAADGVAVQALSEHRIQPGPPGLVLGYAAGTPDQLREAALRIARAVGGSRANRADSRT